MLQRLEDYITQNNLFSKEDKLILAISGGIDSTVLFHILKKLDYNLVLAHMNFQLRADESDGDESFVQKLAFNAGCEFEVKRVDAKKYAAENGLSIQMSARDLRYQWFDELMIKHGAKAVLTAHHSDDSVETVLINLIRGTGISGLKGITNRGNFIRPLLCFNRAEIQAYASLNTIEWREDSSNHKDDYLRNKLRNTIMPKIDEISSSWRDSVIKLTHDIKISEQLLDRFYIDNLPKIYKNKSIDLSKIYEKDLESSWLFRRLLVELNFSHLFIDDLLNNIEQSTGAKHTSKSHELLFNRGVILVKELNTEIEEESVNIQQHDHSFNLNNTQYSIDLKDVDQFEKKFLEHDAYLDFDTLTFPLEIRKWQAADWFVPLGMQGRKKLSDFFIDEKFSIHEKENTFVLCSNKQIVWVLGHRIDNRFKITEATKLVYHIKKQNA